VELTNNSNQTLAVSLGMTRQLVATMFVQVLLARPVHIPKLTAAALWAIPSLLAVTLISLVCALTTPAAMVM
jgi:hypothetical protein